MAETKEFPTNAVVSAITGILICKIDGVYEVLNWMAGEPVFTHQLGRVGKEAWPVVIAMHPEMSVLEAEAKDITRDNWEPWLDKCLERFGDTVAVPRLNIDQHERIDPVSELAEKMHPDQIAVIERG